MLEAARIERDDVAFESGFLRQIDNRIGDAVSEHRLAVDLLGRFLRVKRERCAFRMNHAIADLHFLVLVHERLADIGIMFVPNGSAANEGGPIRNCFLPFSGRKIFARRQHGRGRADRAYWRHVNVLGGERDERAGRTGV